MLLARCGRNPRAPRLQGTQKLSLPIFLAAKKLKEKGYRAVNPIPSGFRLDRGAGTHANTEEGGSS